MENGKCEDERNADREKRWLRIAGPRYAECSLDNFTFYDKQQSAAVELVRNYASGLRSRFVAGESLILFGPKGTGKDHLASAVARMAFWAGCSVRRVSGPVLQGESRDSFHGDASEAAIVERYTTPDFLWLSDPVVPGGKLSDHQMAILYRILDTRYSARLPTLMTANAENRADLEERVGAAIIDRVSHGATVAFCDWPSFRSPELAR